jgi:poly-beta-1,6-N-acetyl-D-glucosamine synthase
MAALFSEDFLAQAFMALFVAVTLVQLLFAAFVLRFFYSQPQGVFAPIEAVHVNKPAVSVLICARNEALNLKNNLPEILAQEYAGDWELLVVDDASTDDTHEILRGFQSQNPRLHILKITEKTQAGKKQGLAAGIEAAKFDHILLTDADCIPKTKSWLRYMAAPFAINPKTEIVLGYGPMQRSPKGRFLQKWTRFETAFTAMQYSTFAHYGRAYMGVGRNLAFKKKVFRQSGGFARHQHIPSGDDDLLVNAAANAANTVCCLHPGTFVYSSAKQSWADWLRQKRRHLSASPAYKWRDKLLLGLLGLSHSLHFFLLFLLLFLGVDCQTALHLWLSRSFLLFIIYKKVFSKLREPDLLSLFPIYDALLAVYYGVLIPIFLIAKKTRSWN